jgi:hypothetical protein
MQNGLLPIGETLAPDDRLDDLADRPGSAEFGNCLQHRPQNLAVLRHLSYDHNLPIFLRSDT